MTRRMLWYSIVVALSLLIASVGVYRQVDARRGTVPAKASVAQRPLVPAPLTVSLSALSDRQVAALGASTFLSVSAAGATISEVRVYDGAALVGVKRFAPALTNRASVQFEWPAVRAGAHVLHAEATGADESQVGHSAPLRLHATRAVVPATSVRIPGNGRTPNQLAAATGIDTRDLTYRDGSGREIPAPRSGRPLAVGVVAQAPIDRITPSSPTGAPDSGPSAISATMDGCRATVAPSGADPVTVYELTGGGVGFTRRGSASVSAPFVTADLTPGTHVFVAGRGDQPADSLPVSVDAPGTCLAEAWSGEATLFDGELALPKPEPRVWVYLGVDGQPFQRIPAQGSVPASFGTADLADLMPTVSGSKIRMQVWRPGKTSAAPATLVAESETTISDRTSVADLLGGAPSVELLSPSGANPVELKAGAPSLRFTWQTANQIPDGVVWQVLGRPLVAADHNTAPPVLLATGFSADGDGGGIKLTSDKSGSFEIPAELLLAGRPASGPVENIVSQVPTPSISQLLEPGSSFGVTPIKAPTAGSIPNLDAGLVPIPIGDVYVRVLPLSGSSVVGDASNTVAVELPPLDPAKAFFTKTKLSFDPGRGANYQLSGCVRITGTPKDATNFLSIYKTDRTWCPSDFDAKKGGGCNGWCQIASDVGSLVAFVGKVWDFIASAYNTVVDTLITVIAKFNPYCLTASVASAISESPYADTAAQGCEAVAKVVASVVVSVVLSSFGLPARLPTSSQLADVVEGDLTGLAVAYLESIGVPCSQMTVDASTVSAVDATGIDVPAGAKNAQGDVDVCAAMISQAVGAIREQVKQAAQAEVANSTGLPLPVAPQEMILEPRGQYLGARVEVRAKPIDPNTARTVRCPVTAIGNVRDWKSGTYEAFEPRDIQQGHGSVTYHPASQYGIGVPWSASLRMAPIQDLIPSERISVSVSSGCFSTPVLGSFSDVQLRPPLGYWYPGQAE